MRLVTDTTLIFKVELPKALFTSVEHFLQGNVPLRHTSYIYRASVYFLISIIFPLFEI